MSSTTLPASANLMFEQASLLIESKMYVQSCNALHGACLAVGDIPLYKVLVVLYKKRYEKAVWWNASYVDRTPETQVARAAALRSMKS